MAILKFEGASGKPVIVNTEDTKHSAVRDVCNEVKEAYCVLRASNFPVKIIDDSGSVLEVNDYIENTRVFGNPYALVLDPKNMIVVTARHHQRHNSENLDDSLFGVIYSHHLKQVEAEPLSPPFIANRWFFKNTSGYSGTFTKQEDEFEFNISGFGPTSTERLVMPPTNGRWITDPSRYIMQLPPRWVRQAIMEYVHARSSVGGC